VLSQPEEKIPGGGMVKEGFQKKRALEKDYRLKGVSDLRAVRF